ncbi:MAG: hypothetical protein JJ896_02640 [Rhodothermales bacterium]|nr:hypothetical protein [Rhodothermales bacterium]
MGPNSVVGSAFSREREGEVVEYTFTFDRWYCGWDALRLDVYEGLRFTQNTHFAWCGPLLGLTPSNHGEATDTIIHLPRRAERVVIHGHRANEHYSFPGGDEPIEALDAAGSVIASGHLEPWFKRLRRGLVLHGRDISRIRMPSSKPVFFLRRIKVYFQAE